jgi:hypothetical protein
LSFSSSGSPGVPTETDAKDRGIALREVRDMVIFGVIYRSIDRCRGGGDM